MFAVSRSSDLLCFSGNLEIRQHFPCFSGWPFFGVTVLTHIAGAMLLLSATLNGDVCMVLLAAHSCPHVEGGGGWEGGGGGGGVMTFC